MERLDTELIKRNIFPSRERAKRAILEGYVEVNGMTVKKPSFPVRDDSVIVSKGDPVPFVSRGGIKLKAALDVFEIDVHGVNAIDVGASTGGFTEVLLINGAKVVYCIDVGKDQLADSIKKDSRVLNFEGMDIRKFVKPEYMEYFDFACVDVSFISLKLIFEDLYKILKKGSNTVALIKPQYEAGKLLIGKGGIVKDKTARLKTVESVKDEASKMFEVCGLCESPIKGGDGNIEYLMWLKKH